MTVEDFIPDQYEDYCFNRNYTIPPKGLESDGRA